MSLRRNIDRRQLFGSSQAYSPGCLTADVGRVYDIGEQVEFGFKYRLKLVEVADIPSSLFNDVPDTGEDLDDSEAAYKAVDGVRYTNLSADQEDTATDANLGTDAEEPQIVLNLAQQILEKRIQDHLQDKLLYCPGSGADTKDLSIDGIRVDLTSFHESDECIVEANNSCTLTGKITIFQRFHNIHGSSLQSIQAGLATLRIGMNEENAFVSKGGLVEEVEFLGGIIGISRQGQGSMGGGQDVSLNRNGAGVSAVILSFAQIGDNAKKMSATGQSIVVFFAMALIALVVVAKRKLRNNNRRHCSQDVNEAVVDDSWTDDGVGRDEAHNETDLNKKQCSQGWRVFQFKA